MTYKVGQIVRIKEVIDKMDDNHAGWDDDMEEYLGTVGVIRGISERGNYAISGFYWAPRWIEPTSRNFLEEE